MASSSPYRQRLYVSQSPPRSPINVDSLVERLKRPNAASAKKAAPWSSPRREYERDTFRTYFPNKERYKRKLEKFGKKQKHYHGNTNDDMSTMTRRVAAPTHTHIKRSYDTILRRRDVEQHKWNHEQADMASNPPGNSRDRESRDSASQDRGRCASVPAVKHHHHHHGSSSSSKPRKGSAAHSH